MTKGSTFKPRTRSELHAHFYAGLHARTHTRTHTHTHKQKQNKIYTTTASERQRNSEMNLAEERAMPQRKKIRR